MTVSTRPIKSGGGPIVADRKAGDLQENPITRRENYNIAMRQSMMDKMFFMDKIGSGVKRILDWGCADGSLIKYMHRMFPEHSYTGFDIDPQMFRAAKQMVAGLNSKLYCEAIDTAMTTGSDHGVEKVNIEICDNIDNVAVGQIDVVVLNSVIHEIYSYGLKDIDEFWHSLFQRLQPEYIVVRDMCVSKPTSRPADPICVARIKQVFDLDKIAQWESKWGSLHENWSLVHFLLTYRYDDNWDREYRENYLPIAFEDLLARFPKTYVPVFVEHYTLPFLREQVMEKFGIQLQDRTHLKLILKKVA